MNSAPTAPHVALEIPHRHRVCGQAHRLEPPEMIDKQVRVRPVRAAAAPAQETIGYRMNFTVREHDRVGDPT